MKTKAQIWIVNDDHSNSSRIKNLIIKIKRYYKIEVNFINSKELNSLIDQKVHVIIFEWTRLSKITNAWFTKLRKRNLHVHSIYLTKSFSETEAIKLSNKTIDYIMSIDNSDAYIMAKIRNVLRRKSDRYLKDTDLYYQDLHINLINRQFYIKDKKVNLSQTEFELLKLLIINAGEFVSKEMILSEVWGYKEDQSRLVSQYIFRLRQKISQEYIHSIHNKGFILK